MNKEDCLRRELNMKHDLDKLLYWCEREPKGNTEIKLKRVGFASGCLTRNVKVDNCFFASVLKEMIKKQDVKIDELIGG